MTLELRELPGSNRPTLGDLSTLGRVPGDEQIVVSVYLKPRDATSAAVLSQATIEIDLPSVGVGRLFTPMIFLRYPRLRIAPALLLLKPMSAGGSFS